MSLTIRKGISSFLGFELDDSGKEYLNEYLTLDESRYLAELQEVHDTPIEIDLIDSKRHPPKQSQQEPKVLYQIGVS